MNTPICDFVKKYVEHRPIRMHMPGHKGKEILGLEAYDITEIDGADELFRPNGIIAESEAYASEIFNSHTFYSTAGSTLAIQTMLYLTALYAESRGEKATILAGRNAHKAFINAAAILRISVKWIFPENGSYYSCSFTADTLENMILSCRPTAVYVTSPDYLGNITDIEKISAVCRQYGVLLLADNAHGAYLKFLNSSLNPIDLGADMCCASAHKTLPVLTGGAYLHISYKAPRMLAKAAKTAMSIFSTSSPSYLILQSLDAANDYMKSLRGTLGAFIEKAECIKKEAESIGIKVIGDEPLKITLCPKDFGYSGTELADIFMKNRIYPEFYDPDFTVLMLSPQNSESELETLLNVLHSLKRQGAISTLPPKPAIPCEAIPPHQAIFSEYEALPAEKCIGRICAASSISCPPAIPIVVCGEYIDAAVIENMSYYGIKSCNVCK